MKEMFRDVIQQVMEVEMDVELVRKRCQRAQEPESTARNYQNGYSNQDPSGGSRKVLWDRNGFFEPKIISKYDRSSDGIEEKILSLYACGMNQRNISEQIKELYDVEPELVSKVSEKIMPRRLPLGRTGRWSLCIC